MIYAACATRKIPPPPGRTFSSFLSFLSVRIPSVSFPPSPHANVSSLLSLAEAPPPTQSPQYQMSARNRPERKSPRYDMKMKVEAAFDSPGDIRCQWGETIGCWGTNSKSMFAFSHRIPEEKQIILTALVPYTVTYTVQEGPQHVSDSAYTYTAHSCQAVHHCPRGGERAKLHWQL